MGNKVSKDKVGEINVLNDETDDKNDAGVLNHYDSNLKLFRSSSQPNGDTLKSSYKGQETRLQRSVSLSHNPPNLLTQPAGPTDNLISEILELSRSFREKLQSSMSVMSLELTDRNKIDLGVDRNTADRDLGVDRNMADRDLGLVSHDHNQETLEVSDVISDTIETEIQTADKTADSPYEVHITNGHGDPISLSGLKSGDCEMSLNMGEGEEDTEIDGDLDQTLVDDEVFGDDEAVECDADNHQEIDLGDIKPDFPEGHSTEIQRRVSFSFAIDIDSELLETSEEQEQSDNVSLECNKRVRFTETNGAESNSRAVRFCTEPPRNETPDHGEVAKVVLSLLDDTPPDDYDSCPSGSDSCPSDSDEEADTFDEPIPLQMPKAPMPRRGRMSVWAPPSVETLEIHQQLRKRKMSKSCGAINEISDEFIEHLEFLKSSDSTFHIEKFAQLKEMARTEAGETGGLKRSNSQTITKEEIQQAVKEGHKSIWNCPKLVRKSKVALAILFMGGRLGTVIQNNIHHINTLTLEESEIMSMTKATSIEKLSKASRAMSFSASRHKNNLSGSTKKFCRTSMNLVTNRGSKYNPLKDTSEWDDNEECEVGLYDERDVVKPLSRKRYATDNDKRRSSGEDSLNKVSMSKRAMSWTELTNQDLHTRVPRRAASSEQLDDNIANQLHVQSCEFLHSKARTDSERTNNSSKRSSLDSAGKNDSSNEFSSDSEDRDDARSRVARSKSITAVTRSMFNARKSVLKKKSRCPPHNYTTTQNKEELSCEECQLTNNNSTENNFLRCSYCEYLVHKTCSMQVLDKSPPPRDKKSHKKLAWNTSKPVALLNKRQPSNNDIREVNTQNGSCKRYTGSRDDSLRVPNSHERSGSIADGSIFNRVSQRSSSPIEHSDDEFTDDSDDYTDDWKNHICKTVLSKMKKDDEKRLHSIHELITTEKNHIKNLKILVKVFRNRLRRKLHITEDDCSQLFPALDDLLNSCTNFYNDLKQEMQSPEPHKTHRLGAILNHHFGSDNPTGICIREAYAHLSEHQKSAIKLFREKCGKDKNFKLLNDHIESKKVCNRNTYSDLMLATTTRLTKFPPLLEALLKHTPTNHPDNQELSDAICTVKDALQYIDNRVKDENTRRDLEECQSRFEVKGRCSRNYKHFDLSSPDRTFKHKGCLTLRTKDKESKILLFLYNDYILLLKEKDNKLILNFDDSMYPVIKVRDCIVKDFAAERMCFILISQAVSDKHSPLHIQNKPILYYLFTNTADQKSSWIKQISEAATDAKNLENSLLSTDDSSDSDLDEVLENGLDSSLVTLSNATPDSLDNGDSMDLLADVAFSPDSLQNHLDNIEEQKDFMPEEIECDGDIDNIMIFLKHLGPGCVRKHPSFNKPLPRPVQKGAAARRATSLLLVEKQRKTDENRRHTTCLSKEELSQVISHSNQTLQDNPVRQKSSDSGYAPEESHQSMTSPIVMKMRDAMVWMYNDNKKKADVISRQEDIISKQQDILDQHSKSLAKLQEEIKQMKSMADYNNYRQRSRQIPSYSSITEEITEPQTRV